MISSLPYTNTRRAACMDLHFLLWDSPAVSNLPSKAIPHFSLQRHHYSIVGFWTHVAIANIVCCLIIICALYAFVCNYFKTKVFSFLRQKCCCESLNYDLSMFHLKQLLHLITVLLAGCSCWQDTGKSFLEERWWKLRPTRALLTKKHGRNFCHLWGTAGNLGMLSILVCRKKPI